MTDDIETAADYQEHYEEQSQESSSRYSQYTRGKAEAVEELGLVGDGEEQDPSDYAAEQQRIVVRKPNTIEAAVAKGKTDAVEDLVELGLFEEEDVDPDPDTDDPPEDDGEEDDGEEEGVERDTETISESGGVEIDADDF